MPNPWLKKNPFLSMWLTAANRMAGSMRGHATAQAKREATSAATKLWSDAWKPAPAKTRPKRKR
jgi:hypothetical protein